MPGLSRPPPMALTFSLTNIMKFLSYMAPFLISFFMIMFSILTGSIVKGLLFISGLLIVTFMNYLLKNSLKSLQDPIANPFCNSLPAPFTLRKDEHIFNSPSTSSTIIAFTLAYLTYPMILKPINMNPVLIAFLVALIGINGAVEVQDRCTNVSGIFLGSLVGILFGIIFFSLVKMSGNESLAFFTEQGSNGIQCSKPGKTNFKCEKKHGVVDDLTLRSLKSVNSNVQMYEKPQFPVCEVGDATDMWDRFIPKCGEMVVGAYGDIDENRPGSKGDCTGRMRQAIKGPLSYDLRHKANPSLGCSNFEKPKCAPGNDGENDKVYAYCGHADPDRDKHSYGTPIFEFDRTNRAGADTSMNIALRLCDVRAEEFNCYHKTGDKAVSYTLPNIPKY